MQSINKQIINSKSINTSQMINANQTINSKSINNSQIVNANETINSKSLNNNIYSLFFEKRGNFIRGVPRTFLMFLIFSILYLSFALEGVFAAMGGGNGGTITDGAGDILDALGYVRDEGAFFEANVLWVPTMKTSHKV